MVLRDEIQAIAQVSHPVGVRIAAECARYVLPIFERRQPGDDRPRKAIEAAERWARNPTEKNRMAAANATDATDAAALAAYAAAYAAAAYAAAYAAHAAYAAVAYAANAATYAAHATDTTAAEKTIRQHLVDTDWLIDYDWTEILTSPRVLASQFPYTYGPFRIWTKTGESCWTLDELRRRRRSRATDEILVAIDAAIQGVRL